MHCVCVCLSENINGDRYLVRNKLVLGTKANFELGYYLPFIALQGTVKR